MGGGEGPAGGLCAVLARKTDSCGAFLRPLACAVLSGAFGDTRVSCRLESYSCKMAGDDKRLFKQLSAKTDIDQMEALSPSPATSSPFGPQAVFLGANGHLAASTGMQYQGSPVFGAAGQQSSSMGTMGATGELHYQCSRRTLYYLKATLNAAFQPDYDFSDAGSHEFSREPSEAWVQRIIAGEPRAAAVLRVAGHTLCAATPRWRPRPCRPGALHLKPPSRLLCVCVG